MNEYNEIKEPVESKENISPKKKVKKTSFVQIISGEFLSKDFIVGNLPFISFIGLMLVVMIGWGYYTETIGKKEIDLEKELGELNSEFFSLGSEYNNLSRQTQVAERLKGTGLKESTNPPLKIKVKKFVY